MAKLVLLRCTSCLASLALRPSNYFNCYREAKKVVTVRHSAAKTDVLTYDFAGAVFHVCIYTLPNIDYPVSLAS